jgi:hypothetical protein
MVLALCVRCAAGSWEIVVGWDHNEGELADPAPNLKTLLVDDPWERTDVVNDNWAAPHSSEALEDVLCRGRSVAVGVLASCSAAVDTMISGGRDEVK